MGGLVSSDEQHAHLVNASLLAALASLDDEDGVVCAAAVLGVDGSVEAVVEQQTARNGDGPRLERAGGGMLEIRLLRRQDEAHFDVVVVREKTRARATLDNTLTGRELQVLELLATGLPDAAIASELDISWHTVRRHVEHVFMKLGVHNRTEAAARFLSES